MLSAGFFYVLIVFLGDVFYHEFTFGFSCFNDGILRNRA